MSLWPQFQSSMVWMPQLTFISESLKVCLQLCGQRTHLCLPLGRRQLPSYSGYINTGSSPLSPQPRLLSIRRQSGGNKWQHPVSRLLWKVQSICAPNTLGSRAVTSQQLQASWLRIGKCYSCSYDVYASEVSGKRIQMRRKNNLRDSRHKKAQNHHSICRLLP